MNALISRLVAQFRNRIEKARAIRELSALDDRSLADIGLTRSDIPFVFARNPVERTPVRAEPVLVIDNIRHAA